MHISVDVINIIILSFSSPFGSGLILIFFFSLAGLNADSSDPGRAAPLLSYVDP